MVRFEASGFRSIEAKILALFRSSTFIEEYKIAFSNHGKRYARELITKNLRGRPGLKRLSGNLARSIVTKTTGSGFGSLQLKIRIGVGLKYASIHETGGVIRPRNSRVLTIPTDSVKTPAGVQKFTPRDLRQRLRNAKIKSIQINGKGYLAAQFKNATDRTRALGRPKKLIELSDPKSKRKTVLLFRYANSVLIPPRLGARGLWQGKIMTDDRQKKILAATRKAIKRAGF